MGGALLTIDGVNFSDDALDNPIKVGDHWCYVKETSATQIKCRIAETGTSDLVTSQVLVFLRTSEEAQSDVDRTFDFIDPVRSITDITNSFDAATNAHIFTVTGTSLPTGDTAAVSLYIDDVMQETVSVTANQAVFKVTDMAAEESDNVMVYFDDGLATGYEAFTSATVIPSLVSISPSAGSAGGSFITVTGTGFGPTSAGVNLKHAPSGSDMCSEVTVTAYGSFTCMTSAMDISSSDQIDLITSTGTFSCANTINSGDCGFEQLAASSPTMSSATLTDSSTIEFTGSDFPTADYTVVAIFKGVESSSAVINSDTSITATFDKGVPLA